MTIRIAYLYDYKEYVTALGQWSFEIWSPYDPEVTRKNQSEKFKQHCNIDTLPLTLIALSDKDELIGMCSLQETDGIRSDLTPWLGSLYVTRSYRNQKVGEKLINATKNIARNRGFEMLYLLTFDPALIRYFVNQGWALMGKDQVNDHPVSIMEIKLA